MTVSYSLMGRRLCSVRPPFDTHEGSASTQQGFRLVRERKRVAWILLLLALLFAACWMPFSILNLLSDAGVVAHDNALIPYSRLLAHSNSAINPIIYCFMTRNFRRSVKELLWRSRAGLAASSRRSNRCQVGRIGRQIQFDTTTESSLPFIYLFKSAIRLSVPLTVERLLGVVGGRTGARIVCRNKLKRTLTRSLFFLFFMRGC